MVNIRELLQRRHEKKPDDADRLGPKGAQPGMGATDSSIADAVLPA